MDASLAASRRPPEHQEIFPERVRVIIAQYKDDFVANKCPYKKVDSNPSFEGWLLDLSEIAVYTDYPKDRVILGTDERNYADLFYSYGSQDGRQVMFLRGVKLVENGTATFEWKGDSTTCDTNPSVEAMFSIVSWVWGKIHVMGERTSL